MTKNNKPLATVSITEASSSTPNLINNQAKRYIYTPNVENTTLTNLTNQEKSILELIYEEEGRKWNGDPNGRYCFDFLLCSKDYQYSQLDNEQDAWYYGTWINLNTYHYLSYCEGDIYFYNFTSLLDLFEYIEKDWERLGFYQIDGMQKDFEYYNVNELLKIDNVREIIQLEKLKINNLQN